MKSIDLPESYEVSTKFIQDRADLKKWLILSLLKRVFGGQPDNVLRIIRKTIQDKPGNFPLNGIIDQFKGTNKTLLFTDEDIQNLTWSKYGQSNTFAVLSLMYPSLDFRNKFHVDHIFPKSKMIERHLKKRGIAADSINTYITYTDYIGNLQLLDAIPNIEKQNKDFDVWLKSIYNDDEINDFRKKHYIPNTDLAIENFIKVFEKREELIVAYLKKTLQLEPVSDVIKDKSSQQII